jgi:hypothetical protein
MHPVQETSLLIPSANYLAVGQIYLLDNPLLRTPLQVSTSNRGSSVIGARRPARTSSTRTLIESFGNTTST